MDDEEYFSTNNAPLFDGTIYAFWSIRMGTYLMALGFCIWKSFVTTYIAPKTLPIDVTGKNPSEHNVKYMKAILCGLSKFKFVNVMHCGSTKEILDKLKNIYEGDDKFNKENLQTHRRYFESLKMKDEENVAAYLLLVDEIVKTIRGLGENVKQPMIVQKVLRSHSLRFDLDYFRHEMRMEI
jgi:hypothetical protein